MSALLCRLALVGPALFGIASALLGPTRERLISAGDGRTPVSEPSFDAFIERFGRSYLPGSAEYEERRKIFSEHVEKISAINSQAAMQLWQAGVSHLTDRSDKELERMRGRRGRANTGEHLVASLLQSSKAPVNCTLPKAISWKHLTAVQSIRNQDACGSCWAAATATMLRAHANIYHNKDTIFSIQQLVNCVPNPQRCGGSGGCSGATAELAMDYVMHNGLKTETDLPYSGVDGSCPSPMVARNPQPVPMPAAGSLLSTMTQAQSLGIIGWQKLPENRQFPLMRALYEAGPVAVSVAANSLWNYYSSGIFNACVNDAVVNHLVVLVAYGEDNGVKYWTLQNSWGSSWGENGYMRLLRTDKETEHCGTDHQPEVGTGCAGGPSQVKVCGMCGILYDSVVPIFAGNTALTQDPHRLQQAACPGR